MKTVSIMMNAVTHYSFSSFTGPFMIISALLLPTATMFGAAGNKSLTANPTSIGFGSVQVGKRETQFETLTNSGKSSITLLSATVAGSGFTMSGLTLPLTLADGYSVTFSITFAPKTIGSASGNLSINFKTSNSTLQVNLSGLGTSSGQLAVSSTTTNFGSVVVGSSKSVTGSLSASLASVTVSSDSLNSPEFTVSGLTFPFTLAAGKSASFTLTFKPQTSGTATANFSVASDASNSPTTESLTGTGTAATQHSVSLSWNPSTSQVLGYNVYRGGQSGGPYAKINSALDTITTYLDISVQGGHTYYYVTTAVNGSGVESGYSNQSKAVVPYP